MDELTPGTQVPLEQVLDDPMAISATPAEIKATDPFGDSKSFEVDKEISVAQLQYEIEEATGATLAFSLHRIPGETGGTLYISPGKNIDGRKVMGKIKSHVPDPLFGLSDEQKRQRQVVEKIRRGEVLTPEEHTIALQSLMNRG